MQRFALCFMRPTSPTVARQKISVFSTTYRHFIQGGPPPGNQKKKRYHAYASSHEDEMQERHRKKMLEIEAYYAQQANKPAPLPENAFVKGQYGMRRRIHRDYESDINVQSLNEAVDIGVNAMRK
ncbi:unnamed protein product [Phytomonas sp. EM1]|nr:unnamed protein product [Phytomonas sp. EM1]|eukprot:CCW61226.1 unnamed protein product [Phytomonas sp. isolate EM1]